MKKYNYEAKTKEEIYFETNLMGPTDNGEPKGETYPYIVVKTEYMEKDAKRQHIF